jgi:hypothetical protein
MKFIILRGKHSGSFFGIQLVCGRYIVQAAYGKLGVYNSHRCLWMFEGGK